MNDSQTTTVLITGIGGSIGIDVARSLRRDPSIRLIGCDSSPWGSRQTAGLVDEQVALPRADRGPAAFVDALCAAVEKHRVDFAFVNPDPELEAVAETGRDLPCPSSMPPVATVGVSLDKGRTVAQVGVPELFPATFDLADPADLQRGFDTLEPPLWMRSTVGAGGRGSLVVETVEEARAWIDYWARRERNYHWVLQELLPGDNINWTGIYRQGELLATTAMVRIAYFLGATTASGVSGQVSQCATVDPSDYHEISERVVRALDATPHGIYSVDLRHDRAGEPRVTEVNPRLAGRPWLYTNAGVNLPLVAVRGLLGRDLGDAVSPDGLQIGLHLYRQLDIEPVIGFPEE